MKHENVVERIEGTDIIWKDGDPTHETKEKKNKKGKKITKIIKVPSFFDLFASHAAYEEVKDKVSESETADQIDKALTLGNEIKDSIVPLALEQYLQVIEVGADDSEDNDDDWSDDDGVEDKVTTK